MTMPAGLSGISSMATRNLLAELADSYAKTAGQTVAIESVGGVTAADRIRAGESFDFAVLARNVMEKLEADGFLRPGSLVDLARSPIAFAVREGAPAPDIASEDGVKRAVAAARAIGYSTGPSGTHFENLLKKWGLWDTTKDRLVVPPPGTPVAQLLAQGKIEVGVQQLSEFVTATGIAIVGLLPDAIQSVTTFTAGLCKNAADAEAAARFLQFMASPAAAEAKQRQGLQP